MKRQYIYILLAVIFLSSCASKKAKIPTAVNTDSVRVEIREKEVYITDTIFVKIPIQNEVQTIKDTISFLQNDYCTTIAKILPNGDLFHNLLTNDFKLPIEVQTKTIYKDSMVYKDKYIEQPVMKEVEGRVKFSQKMGYIFLGVILTILAINAKKIFDFFSNLRK